MRLLGIGNREFWHDEYCSLLYATAPEGTIASLRAGGNPPLYFLLLHGWTSLFGFEEGAVRALSALASALSLGALGMWLRSLGLPRRAALWAAAIGALTPLHIFYGREARGYALMLLMLCSGLWALTEALRHGSIRWWGLYAILLAAGFYTHNLLLSTAALHWVIAAILSKTCAPSPIANSSRAPSPIATPSRRRPSRVWLFLLASQAAAFAVYAPWVMVLTQQPYGEQSKWIARFWQQDPPVLAIPRSLLAFGIGGKIPSYIAWAPTTIEIVVLSAFWSAFLAVLAFVAARDGRILTHGSRLANERDESPIAVARSLAVLVLMTLGPLVGLWLVSALVRPAYIVGRYDLPALPAFLGVMGLGVHALQIAVRRAAPSWVAWGIPLVVVSVLLAGGVLPRYREDLGRPPDHSDRVRAALVARRATPEDLVISVDLAASSVLFRSRASGISARQATFPREILAHWGWFNVEDAFERGRDTLVAEAEAAIADHERAHGGRGRIWILPHLKVLDPPGVSPKGRHQELYDLLLQACRNQGLVTSYPEGESVEAFRRLGILPLAHSGR